MAVLFLSSCMNNLTLQASLPLLRKAYAAAVRLTPYLFQPELMPVPAPAKMPAKQVMRIERSGPYISAPVLYWPNTIRSKLQISYVP